MYVSILNLGYGTYTVRVKKQPVTDQILHRLIILPFTYSSCGYQCCHSWLLLFAFYGMGVYSSDFWN